MGFGGIRVDAEGFKLGEFAETFVSVIVECCHDAYYNIIKKYERIQIYFTILQSSVVYNYFVCRVAFCNNCLSPRQNHNIFSRFFPVIAVTE